MSEKSSNGVGAVSSLAVEMREAIIELAGDPRVFDTRSRWLERAARAAGISTRMAKSLFYGEHCNPSAEVVDRVRGALDNLRTKAKGERDVAVQAAREYQELMRRIEQLERALLSDAQPDRLAAAAGGASGGRRRGSGGAVD